MIKSLSLIIIIILSLFLVFYCVDSHKSTILSLINMEKRVEVAKPALEKVIVAETEVVGESQIIEEVKKETSTYVETLAVDSESIPKIEKDKVVEEITPNQVEITAIKLETIEEAPISENRENNELEDLERMILEELKNGEKD